jgi:hypothetical protein
MKEQSNDFIDRCQQVSDSVKKNLHLLKSEDIQNYEYTSLVRFNSRIILSDNKEFLEAVKTEIGGEIIEDSHIGLYLFYGELRS